MAQDDPSTTATVDDSKLAAWDLLDEDDGVEAPAPDGAAPSVPAEAQPSSTSAASEPAAAENAPPTSAPPVPPTVAPAVTPPPAASATTAPPSEQSPTETPYAFKADGKELPITGAVRLPNGDVRIPAAVIPKMHHYLADRTEVQRVLGERQRTESDLRTQLDTVQQTKNGLLERFQQLLDLAGTDPEALITYAVKARQELPTYVAELQRREKDTETEQLRQRLAEIEFNAALPQLEPVWRDTVGQHVRQLVAHDPALADLPVDALANAVWEDRSLGVLVRAPSDAPDGSFKRGDVAIHLPTLTQLLQRHAVTERRILQERQKAITEAETRAAAAKATAQNTATLTPPTVPQVRVGSKTPGPLVRTKQSVNQPRNDDGTFAGAGKKSAAESFDDEWAKLDLGPDD